MANVALQPWTHQPGGDVSIMLGAGNNYVLMSEPLRKHSPFFAALLLDENTDVLESRSRDVRRIRWKIELVERPEPGVTGAGVLEMLPINDKGQTLPGGRRCPTDPQNGGIPNPVYRHYNRVLGALYSEQFEVDSSERFIDTLHDILGLLEVAEYLGCVDNIAPTVQSAMLTKGVELYKNVANTPCSWALLAARIKSEVIFKDAVVHMVGRWQDPGLANKKLLSDYVMQLCERKHEELNRFKKKVEQRIVNYYPKEMKRDPQSPSSTYNRTAYANEIFTWMASTCCKQWFASVVVQDMHRHGPDGGYWLYSKMGMGGHAYITEAEMVDFHRVFPLSQKGRACFQEKMLEMKQEMKAIVRPLLANESQLDPKEMGLRYLTCCKVSREDCPWITTAAAAAAAGAASSAAASPPPPPPPPPPTVGRVDQDGRKRRANVPSDEHGRKALTSVIRGIINEGDSDSELSNSGLFV